MGRPSRLTKENMLAELRKFVRIHGRKFTAQEFSKGCPKVGWAWQNSWGTWNRFLAELGMHTQPGTQPKVTISGPSTRIDVKDGQVFVGSDAHYWATTPSTAHAAFVHLAKELKPEVFIMNGDMLDGASISRFPSIGWEQKPTLIQEIECVRDRLDEIVKARPGGKRFWTLGNHDSRFETAIANKLPEFANVHGVHLKDHFPEWTPAWSIMINAEQRQPCMVKHRIKGGVHAPRNNVLAAGTHVVTGHLHSQRVHGHTNYVGTWYGVDAGTMLEPAFGAGDTWGPQVVHYLENNPVDWRAGFVVLTFENYHLMPPSLVSVIEPGVVWFEGRRIVVGDVLTGKQK
jgi:hypothetical protein